MNLRLTLIPRFTKALLSPPLMGYDSNKYERRNETTQRYDPIGNL
jgi:hypothetical protein